MMNVLALGLVLTSLLTAGFFTPSPENKKLKDDVIVKEGHRVVVVEYEKEDGNTKVSILPQDSRTAGKVDDKMSERRENVKETIKEEGIHHGFGAKELACDAYGKCKEKIASAMGRTVETAAAAGETAETPVERAKEIVNEAIGKVKDTVTHTAHKASDKIQEKKENLKDEIQEKKENLKDSASEISRKTEEEVAKKAIGVIKEGQKELSEILGRVYEVGADVSNYVLSHKRVNSLTGILHLMGFAVAYGMCVWVTFVSSYVLAGALPRYQFAMMQSKIYPTYFKAMAYSVGMAILGHWMSEGKRLSLSNVEMFRGFELTAALVMILVNLVWLEPKANKVMLERMKTEKEEGKVTGSHATATDPSRVLDSIAETAGRGPTGGTTTTPGATQEKPEEEAAKSQIIQLSATLQRLNSYSSFLNVLTLMSLTWHLGHLGQRLHTVC